MIALLTPHDFDTTPKFKASSFLLIHSPAFIHQYHQRTMSLLGLGPSPSHTNSQDQESSQTGECMPQEQQDGIIFLTNVALSAGREDIEELLGNGLEVNPVLLVNGPDQSSFYWVERYADERHHEALLQTPIPFVVMKCQRWRGRAFIQLKDPALTDMAVARLHRQKCRDRPLQARVSTLASRHEALIAYSACVLRERVRDVDASAAPQSQQLFTRTRSEADGGPDNEEVYTWKTHLVVRMRGFEYGVVPQRIWDFITTVVDENVNSQLAITMPRHLGGTQTGDVFVRTPFNLGIVRDLLTLNRAAEGKRFIEVMESTEVDKQRVIASDEKRPAPVGQLARSQAQRERYITQLQIRCLGPLSQQQQLTDVLVGTGWGGNARNPSVPSRLAPARVCTEEVSFKNGAYIPHPSLTQLPSWVAASPKAAAEHQHLLKRQPQAPPQSYAAPPSATLGSKYCPDTAPQQPFSIMPTGYVSRSYPNYLHTPASEAPYWMVPVPQQQQLELVPALLHAAPQVHPNMVLMQMPTSCPARTEGAWYPVSGPVPLSRL